MHVSLNESAVAISSSVSFPQEYKTQPFPGVTLKPVGGGWLQFIFSLLKNKEEFPLYAILGSHGSLSTLLLLCQRQMEFCFLFQGTLKYYFLGSYSSMFFPKYHIVVFLKNCPDQKHKATVHFLLIFPSVTVA